MELKFTKMQGAGNDFIVLDATHMPIEIDAGIFKRLADRHFGIGADQILIVGPSPAPGIDFSYRIINADGSEVEQCGNGARCFMRYVHDKKLTSKTSVAVRTMSGDIVLQMQDNGLITVNMGAPIFELARIPFSPGPLQPQPYGNWQCWPLPVLVNGQTQTTDCAVVSMGNPHAVICVDDIQNAPVSEIGPLIENHACFPKRTNVGFMQIISRTQAKVRVFERGAGETLACGTGICAAVVCCIRLGWLDEQVNVQAQGGLLQICWKGASQGLQSPVWMSGPAETVFEGVIEL